MKVSTAAFALVLILSLTCVLSKRIHRERRNSNCVWSSWKVGNCSSVCGAPTATRTRECLCSEETTTPDCEGSSSDVVYCMTPCTRTPGYWRYHHSKSSRPNFKHPWPINEMTTFSCENGPNSNKSSIPWIGIINLPPQNDKWMRIAGHYISARLNIAMGAPTNRDVSKALEDAEYVLSFCDSLAGIQKQVVDEVYRFLASFNNGHETSPRCDETPCCFLDEETCKCPGYDGLYETLQPFCDSLNPISPSQVDSVPQSVPQRELNNEQESNNEQEINNEQEPEPEPEQVKVDNCYWGDWEQFTACPVECGGGEVSRVKNCFCAGEEQPQEPAKCQGEQPKEVQPCNSNLCNGAKAPSYWATHNHLQSGENNIPWPNESESFTFECDRGSNQEASEVTWVNILLSTNADLWTSLAQQYIAAYLNKESNVTLNEVVSQSFTNAEFLVRDCDGFNEEESAQVNHVISVLKNFNLNLPISDENIEITNDPSNSHDTLRNDAGQGSSHALKESKHITFNGETNTNEDSQAAGPSGSSFSQELFNLVSTFYVSIPVAVILVVAVTITITVLVMRKIYKGRIYEIPEIPDDGDLDPEPIDLDDVTLDDDEYDPEKDQ